MKCIKPTALSGTITAPSSKSVLQRVAAAALLTPGTSRIRHTSLCDDSRAALRAAQSLGAVITEETEGVLIHGGAVRGGVTVDCGEAGLSLRMFTPLAALASEPVVLTGRGSLLTRPMEMMTAPLQDLGASCRTRDGRLPLTVHGPLRGGETTVDGAVTSQFLTGLLLALPCAAADSRLHVPGLQSKPYIRLTLEVLRAFGGRVECGEELEEFHVPGGQRYTAPGCFTVEGDWSAAAFWLAAGAMTGEVTLRGLHPESAQADRVVLEILHQAGAVLHCTGDTVQVRAGDLRAFTCDLRHCPDLFPPLAVLALGCRGTSRFRGGERLRHKESDRAVVMAEMFRAIGAVMRVQADVIEIDGGRPRGGEVTAHNDHRIAMAAAVAGLISHQGVTVHGEECVAKSYPHFFQDLHRLGGIHE